MDITPHLCRKKRSKITFKITLVLTQVIGLNSRGKGGEPTLLGLDFYKQAVEFQQQFANGKQITNAFQTNGIALNQQWVEFFKEHHFLIGLSIDGLSAVHNRYRISGNGNPTFEKVVKALELLKKKRSGI